MFFLRFISSCLVLLLALKTRTQKKIQQLVLFSVLFYFVIMFPPKFEMEEIKMRSGDIIGRDNREEFLTFVSRLYDDNDKSIVESTYNYESTISCFNV